MARYWNDASQTDINIINQALDLIHAKNIATIGAGLTSEEEQKAANVYEDTRDLLLSRFAWTFALNVATILNYGSAQGSNAASIPDPYSYISTLPAQCLRVLKVANYTGAWKRYLKNYILCDINTNVDDFEIQYVRQIKDADLFDPNFREIFILKLAQKLAPPVRDKNFLDLYKMEQMEIREAMRIHAIEDAEFEDENKHEDDDEWVSAGR